MSTTNPPSITVYGIASCDSVKKARAWMTQQGYAYQWHDFKKSGLPSTLLIEWMHTLGNAQLINRKGTTWRTLTPAQQGSMVDDESAIAIALEYHSLIKRPVVQWAGQGGQHLSVGFCPDTWAQWR